MRKKIKVREGRIDDLEGILLVELLICTSVPINARKLTSFKIINLRVYVL